MLKRGPRRHRFVSALACIPILLVLSAVTQKAGAQLTILHSFGDGSVPNDGANPQDALIQTPNGDFFGVTTVQAQTPHTDAGTVFKMTAAGKLKIIYRFGLKSNMWPSSPLLYYQQKLVGLLSGSAVFALTNSKRGWHVSIWHLFNGGLNGAGPAGGLTVGPDGKLYGVTEGGGTNGAGTAYKLDHSASQPFSIVYNFSTTDYWRPGAALVLANDGNFYGSTMQWGSFSGGIFRLTPQGQLTGIWSLFPPTQAPLIQTSDGNFYTTIPLYEHYLGYILKVGTSCCGALLHPFGLYDGVNPVGALVQGPNGHLYGAATAGGTAGGGTIFEISTDGSFFKVLHNFGDGSVPHDGASPNGGLVLGRDGNLYGTTYQGGSAGLGTIFKIAP